jgi:ProP effector
VSGNSKIDRAKQAVSLITCFADMFPAAFSLYQFKRQPLKIGVGRDLAAALKGAVSDAEMNLALGYYTRNAGYLAACKQGAARVDLDGKAVGHVTADEAAHAAEVLAQRRARARKPHKVGTVKRITLADLKAAAQARKVAS